MTKILVIAHAECLDGHCAAWAAHRAFSERTDLQVTYHFAYHGSESPSIVGYDEVYLLDFAYPRKIMKDICRYVKKVVVLDHHISNKEDLLTDRTPEIKKLFESKVIDEKTCQELISNEIETLKLFADSCFFDLTKSGATLAWDYFMGGMRPWLVEYVEDGDLWKWEKDRSKHVNAAIFSYPRTFDAWDILARTPLADIKYEGSAIYRYQQRLIEETARKVTFITVGDYRVPAVNTTVLASEIASRIAQENDTLFGVVWHQLPDGKFKYSLRKNPDSDDTPNLSQIARAYGGGGHWNSSSFRSSKPLI